MGFDEILTRIREAQIEATRNAIRANTIIISDRLSKTKPFGLVYDTGNIYLFPPMILGMEIRVGKDLPEEYDFAICEVPETERERVRREAAEEARRKLIGGVIGMLNTYLEEIPLPERANKRKVRSFIRSIIRDLEEMRE